MLEAPEIWLFMKTWVCTKHVGHTGGWRHAKPYSVALITGTQDSLSGILWGAWNLRSPSGNANGTPCSIEDSLALVFHGGTALNKLFLKPPARYSEDIDFVQKRLEPIGKIIDTIRILLKPWLGDPQWKVTQRGAKLIYKYESINKLPTKLKIEINNTEHFQVLPLHLEKLNVQSEWFNHSLDVVTYELDELMATKLCTLYQHWKGQDLFDLWYVTKQELIDLDR